MRGRTGWSPDKYARPSNDRPTTKGAGGVRKPRPFLLRGARRLAEASALNLLHPRGAELEFGNLAERIELRIRQNICGRLCIAERDEHHPRRHCAIGARL